MCILDYFLFSWYAQEQLTDQHRILRENILALAAALGGSLDNFDRRRLDESVSSQLAWEGDTPYNLLASINATIGAISEHGIEGAGLTEVLTSIETTLGIKIDGSPSILELLKNPGFGLQSIKRTLDETIAVELATVLKEVNGLNTNNTLKIIEQISDESKIFTTNRTLETKLVVQKIGELKEEVLDLELLLVNATTGLPGIRGDLMHARESIVGILNGPTCGLCHMKNELRSGLSSAQSSISNLTKVVENNEANLRSLVENNEANLRSQINEIKASLATQFDLSNTASTNPTQGRSAGGTTVGALVGDAYGLQAAVHCAPMPKRPDNESNVFFIDILVSSLSNSQASDATVASVSAFYMSKDGEYSNRDGNITRTKSMRTGIQYVSVMFESDNDLPDGTSIATLYVLVKKDALEKPVVFEWNCKVEGYQQSEGPSTTPSVAPSRSPSENPSKVSHHLNIPPEPIA